MDNDNLYSKTIISSMSTSIKNTTEYFSELDMEMLVISSTEYGTPRLPTIMTPSWYWGGFGSTGLMRGETPVRNAPSPLHKRPVMWALIYSLLSAWTNVKQTAQLPVIGDAITPVWRYGNAILRQKANDTLKVTQVGINNDWPVGSHPLQITKENKDYLTSDRNSQSTK